MHSIDHGLFDNGYVSDLPYRLRLRIENDAPNHVDAKSWIEKNSTTEYDRFSRIYFCDMFACSRPAFTLSDLELSGGYFKNLAYSEMKKEFEVSELKFMQSLKSFFNGGGYLHHFHQVATSIQF